MGRRHAYRYILCYKSLLYLCSIVLCVIISLTVLWYSVTLFINTIHLYMVMAELIHFGTHLVALKLKLKLSPFSISLNIFLHHPLCNTSQVILTTVINSSTLIMSHPVLYIYNQIYRQPNNCFSKHSTANMHELIKE